MKVIEKEECQKAEVIRNEIESLKNLIDRRHAWLNRSVNKPRKTFKAVLQDTNEMESILEDLQQKLKETEELTNT